MSKKVKQQLQYINLKYKPKKTEVLVLYKPKMKKGFSVEYAAENLAAESSIGTWTNLCTMNKKIAQQLKPNVYKIDKKSGLVYIAYPVKLFEIGNMSGILSSICGNIFGMDFLDGLRVCDIQFPKAMVTSFPGPYHGIAGTRKILKKKKGPLTGTIVKGRPVTGTIIKPKVGLTSKQHAQVGYEAWVGIDGRGLDIVKDDENLTSMTFNQFDSRAKLTCKAKKIAEKVTGHKKLWLANITHSNFDEMMRRDALLRKLGNEVTMLDVVTLGFNAVHTYRLKNTKQIIHAHRAMHGTITRTPGFSMSMLLLAKVYRMLGVDLLHVGTAGTGKMEGGAKETMVLVEAIQANKIKADASKEILGQEWYGMKPVVAVASGGLYPGAIPTVVKYMGRDIVCQMGGGCHGHPDGTRGGATGIVEAVDSVMVAQPIRKYAKKRKMLKKALDEWGV
jgi:ribulose-bisphosphate carboxylase large chain